MFEEYQRGFSIGSGIGAGLLSFVIAMVMVAYLYSYITSWWGSRRSPSPQYSDVVFQPFNDGSPALLIDAHGPEHAHYSGTVWSNVTNKSRSFKGESPAIPLTEDEAASSILVVDVSVWRADKTLFNRFARTVHPPAFMSSASGETPDSA